MLTTPPCLDQPTVENLYNWCYANGIQVCTQYDLEDPHTWGGYHRPLKIIYLTRTLPEIWTPAVLSHEIIHAYYDHDGHQDKATEKHIDEAVAQALINPTEYAYWEEQHSGHVGAIALELEQPTWIIQAYQRYLSKKF